MVASTEKDTESKDVEIVEKRVKRTVIRRRARKVEPAAVETPVEEDKKDAKPAVSESVKQEKPVAAKAAEPVPSADVEPDKPVKATEETSVPAEDDKAPVRKIGVVGHIDELA